MAPVIEIRTGLLPDDTETCARLWVRAIALYERLGFAAYGIARPHGIGDYAMQPYRLALASATPSSV